MRLIKVSALLAGIIAGAGITDAHAGLSAYRSSCFSASGGQFSDPSQGIANECIANEYGGAGEIILNGPDPRSVWRVDLSDRLPGSGTYNFGVNPPPVAPGRRADLTVPSLSLPGRLAAGPFQS